MLGAFTTAGGGGGGAAVAAAGGSGAAYAAAMELQNEVGGGGGEAAEEEERGSREAEGIEQNSAASRWPREETLALLRIRSEMDPVFREATAKRPLWDEVSRKMGEIGYHRTGKKCEEKFKNIYKYHKRTREGRCGQEHGKSYGREHGESYRFFEQLEFFGDQTMPSSTSSNLNQMPMTGTTMAIPLTMMMSTPIMSNPTSACQDSRIACPTGNPMSYSTSTTSSTERESEGSVRKKRRMTDYFQSLMKSVLEKQENFQNKFLEAIEKCEKDRVAREEAWRAQEMARIQREQAILAHERAVVASNYAIVISCMQTLSNEATQVQSTGMAPVSVEQVDNLELLVRNNDDEVNVTDKRVDKQENGVGENSSPGCSSRWPKAEVEALVRLRSRYNLHVQECGPKGPCWEEISLAMKKLGYDRSAKKCKEKWENINKYYKRVKQSNKKRPENSKTCPYFNLLESLYVNKSKMVEYSSDSSGCNLKPEYILMQMIGQQQQQQQEQQQYFPILQDKGNILGADEDDSGDGYQSVAISPSVVAILE